MRDALPQRGNRQVLQGEVAVEDLLHVLADHEPAEVLQIGQAFEKQDPLDELVRMLHLIDGFFRIHISRVS